MHPETITLKQKWVFDKLKNFSEYYLAGGTALALQIGHRVSVDFDFFSEKKVSPSLLTKIQKIFKGSKIKITVNQAEQLTVNIEGINLTFANYPFRPIFKLKGYKKVKLFSVPEIAAAKAYALGRRATFKDYVDLYFILKKRYLTLPKIIEIAQKKYKELFDPRLFLEELIYLQDVEDVKIKFLRKEITKIQLQKFFEEEVKKLKI